MTKIKKDLDSTGVSPVVGVILMVAITVGLAAVVGITVFGVGDQVDSTTTGTVELETETSGESYTITANSGQFEEFEYVYVQSSTDSDISYSGGISSEENANNSVTYVDGPNNSTQYLYTNSSGGAGTAVEINTSTASESGQVQVIGIQDGQKTVLNSYEYEASGPERTSSPTNLAGIQSNMTGTGTSENPYEISNVYELQAVQEDLDANYIVVNNIDARGTSSWNNSFEPIGDTFSGSIDGQNYQINGLTVNQPDGNDVGIFKFMSGMIENVKISNADVVAGDFDSGIVAGEISGTVKNTSVSGTIEGGDNVGVIAGGLSGTIQDVVSSADANGTSKVGGIAGSSFTGTVTNSKITGDISAKTRAGGVLGYFASGTVSEVAVSSDVEGEEARVGGIAAFVNEGTIEDSYSTGKVSAGSPGVPNENTPGGNVGGIVGYNTNGEIRSVYTTSSVSEVNKSGAVVGFNENGVIEDAYWDTDATGQSAAVSGQGNGTETNVNELSTSDMQGDTPLATMSALDFNTVWDTTDTYPQLQWE